MLLMLHRPSRKDMARNHYIRPSSERRRRLSSSGTYESLRQMPQLRDRLPSPVSVANKYYLAQRRFMMPSHHSGSTLKSKPIGRYRSRELISTSHDVTDIMMTKYDRSLAVGFCVCVLSMMVFIHCIKLTFP